jgi:nucleoside phosphorylase
MVEAGPGNAGAAAIAVRALEHYKPHVALFVGVAGGIKDVAIGDVVVATKV